VTISPRDAKLARSAGERLLRLEAIAHRRMAGADINPIGCLYA
jgi:hypothetical protein